MKKYLLKEIYENSVRKVREQESWEESFWSQKPSNTDLRQYSFKEATIRSVCGAIWDPAQNKRTVSWP